LVSVVVDVIVGLIVLLVSLDLLDIIVLVSIDIVDAVVGLVVFEGSINLLDVCKYHLWVKAARADHVVHVVAGNKVRNAGKPLSGLEGQLVIGLAVVRGQAREVKCLWEEMMNESAEAQTIGPRIGEVGNLNVVVLPCSALAPNQDSLHLGGHHLGSTT